MHSHVSLPIEVANIIKETKSMILRYKQKLKPLLVEFYESRPVYCDAVPSFSWISYVPKGHHIGNQIQKGVTGSTLGFTDQIETASGPWLEDVMLNHCLVRCMKVEII